MLSSEQPCEVGDSEKEWLAQCHLVVSQLSGDMIRTSNSPFSFLTILFHWTTPLEKSFQKYKLTWNKSNSASAIRKWTAMIFFGRKPVLLSFPLSPFTTTTTINQQRIITELHCRVDHSLILPPERSMICISMRQIALPDPTGDYRICPEQNFL